MLTTGETLYFLLFSLIALIAGLLSRRNQEFARKAVRVLPLVAATIFLGAIVSGWTRFEPAALSIHKWSSHALVIAIWLFVPFSVGVAMQQHFRKRPGIMTAQVVVLLLVLSLVTLASFTGYLAPSLPKNITEETKNRFTVLHLFALPSLITILLCVWHWLFRPRQYYAVEQNDASEQE